MNDYSFGVLEGALVGGLVGAALGYGVFCASYVATMEALTAQVRQLLRGTELADGASARGRSAKEKT